MDLYETARNMMYKSLTEDGSHVFESPLLSKVKATKLAEDYLAPFNAKMFPINPQIPEVSSYVVAISGGQNA